MVRRKLQPVKKQSWRKLLTGTMAHEGPMLDEVYPEALQSMKRTHAGAEGNCYEMTIIPHSRSHSA